MEEFTAENIVTLTRGSQNLLESKELQEAYQNNKIVIMEHIINAAEHGRYQVSIDRIKLVEDNNKHLTWLNDAGFSYSNQILTEYPLKLGMLRIKWG